MSKEIAKAGNTLQAADNMMSIIQQVVALPNFDADKLGKLLDMQERIMSKNAEVAFNQALARVSALIPRIKRTKGVSYKDKEAFKFTPYEEIDAIIRPLMAEEGFSLSFTSEMRPGDGGGLIVTGTLSHKDGHSKPASISLALDSSGGKNSIQGMGSTFSYGKRYTACMLLNIVTENEDDDGQSSSKSQAIDADSVATIKAKLEEVRANVEMFLNYMGVKSLEEITLGEYPKAINAIMRKSKGAAK